MRVQFLTTWREGLVLPEVTPFGDISGCLVPQGSPSELLASQGTLLSTSPAENLEWCGELEWVCCPRPGLPALSAFPLPAGQLALISTA